MEKITDNDLKEMLTKSEEQTEDLSDVIVNEETGEVQWVKINDAIIPEQAELNEENLEEQLEQEIDFNKIPENVDNGYEDMSLDPVIEQRKDLNVGLTPEDIKDLYLYVSGKGEKPLYIDKFTSDAEGRLKDMTLVMAQLQLAQIPTLTALRNQVQERLFAPENLYDMDSKTLSATMSNLTKDIQNIIDGSIKAIQTTSQFGTLNSKYRDLVNSMIMLPPEKLELIEKAVFEDKLEK